jgi:hypothetical protein
MDDVAEPPGGLGHRIQRAVPSGPRKGSHQIFVPFRKSAQGCSGDAVSDFESFDYFTDQSLVPEAHHGPAENHVYEYDPTFIMRGLSALHVEFEPV